MFTEPKYMLGNVLSALGYYKEAIIAYDQAIKYNTKAGI